MDFDPDLHPLSRGYAQRVPPEHLADTDESGIAGQPYVYPEALDRKHDDTAPARDKQVRAERLGPAAGGSSQ